MKMKNNNKNILIATLVITCSLLSVASADVNDLYISVVGPETGQDNAAVLKYDWNLLNVTTFLTDSTNLSWPFGLAFSPHNGNLYVAGNNTGTVMQYNGNTGALVGTVASGLGATYGLAFGPHNALYVTSNNYHNVTIIPLSGGSPTYLGIGSPWYPTGIAFDDNGDMYVAGYGPSTTDTEPNKHDDGIWKFTYTGSNPANPYDPANWVGFKLADSAWYAGGNTDNMLYLPQDLKIGPNGNLFVSVDPYHRVLEFDISSGRYLRDAVPYRGGTPPEGEDALWHPRGISFTSSGNILVAYEFNGIVYEFDGTTGARIGSRAEGLFNPRGLATKREALYRCGDMWHAYPDGDLTQDCKVNMYDFAVIAGQWLSCTAPNCN